MGLLQILRVTQYLLKVKEGIWCFFVLNKLKTLPSVSIVRFFLNKNMNLLGAKGGQIN